MSLSAIQDSLVKTSLVQQTQTRGDGVQRSQEIGQTAAQREHDRQEDQVVIHAKESEQTGIRPDEEKEKEERKKRREEEEEEEEKNAESEENPDDPEKKDARAVMRRINIVV